MKKIFALVLISIGILLVLPSVEAKRCCQIASYYYCTSGDSCPAGGPVDCSHCDACNCCGLDTGCDACGPPLDPCRANLVCNNYKCGVCLRGTIELNYCWHLDEAQCPVCTGCYWDGIAHSCKGTPSIITASGCTNCQGTWNPNGCNSYGKTCCYTTTQQGLCTGGTALNPSCASPVACPDSCVNKKLKYNCICSGGVGAAECQCLVSKDVDCCNDNDCTGYDATTHTKRICDCPSAGCTYPAPPTGSDDYTCKPKPYCAFNSECDTNWCCTYDSDIPLDDRESPGSCSYSSINPIYKNKYLCDPPGWTTTEKQNSNLIDSVVNFFSNLFS